MKEKLARKIFILSTENINYSAWKDFSLRNVYSNEKAHVCVEKAKNK